MSLFSNSSQYDEYEKQREVAELNHLAHDARDEGKYATAEQLLEQAEQVALALGPVHFPSLIKTRTWLAHARKMQGKFTQAFVNYTWLVAITTDPSQAVNLISDEDSLWCLAMAYMELVACGMLLPELEVEKLLAVVRDGLRWLEQVDKTEWSGGLRLQRGDLYKMQGQYEQALVEIEDAIALKRRYPTTPGFTLASYLLQLADMSILFGEWERVVELAEEVLAPDFRADAIARWQAYTLLGWGRLAQEEQMNQAKEAALASLNLAQAIESPTPLYGTYKLLWTMYLMQGELGEAAGAAVQMWRYARKTGIVGLRCVSLIDCASMRLAQASMWVAWETSSLSSTTEEGVGEGLGRGGLNEESKVKSIGRQLLDSARRFIGWATPLAHKLDRAARSHQYQNILDVIRQQWEELAAQLD
jgi:tetratricopeptide (TPR) repeat protein